MTEVKVTRWHSKQPATEAAIQCLLREEALSASAWQNGPHDIYAAHCHSYDKVIYVVRGSITFGLTELGQSVSLTAGDRLDLARGVWHHAQVGPEGVVCLEAHLP